MSNKLYKMGYFKIMTIYLLSSIGYIFSDIEKCTEPIKHYKELGCHPAVEEGRHCPTRYLCPNLTQFEEDRCHYREKEYYATQRLTDDKTADQCVTRCTCSDAVTPRAFKCKEINCPHTNGEVDPTKCVGQYNFGKCCPEKYLCDEAEIEELAQCKYDGEIYLEGEKFYPEKEKCWSCICRKKFDTTKIIGNPNCREIDCGIELRYFSELRRGCIPIYYEDRCCPTDWKCPEPTDTIQRNGFPKFGQKNYCRYGDLKLKLGDILKTEDKCLKCVCGIPPIAHCMIDEDCVVEEDSQR
uniref:CSON006945 protein n=1 Tax=Culicoides sonorensis TaxID=179676 RepID=A0A336MYP2_CULSO